MKVIELYRNRNLNLYSLIFKFFITVIQNKSSLELFQSEPLYNSLKQLLSELIQALE